MLLSFIITIEYLVKTLFAVWEPTYLLTCVYVNYLKHSIKKELKVDEQIKSPISPHLLNRVDEHFQFIRFYIRNNIGVKTG